MKGAFMDRALQLNCCRKQLEIEAQRAFAASDVIIFLFWSVGGDMKNNQVFMMMTLLACVKFSHRRSAVCTSIFQSFV